MEHEDKAQGGSPRRAMLESASAKIKAQNEADRQSRNARRWNAERGPLEYEEQKKRQREEYAHKKGGVVRDYEKIVAESKAEHEQVAKARHAKRGKDRYAAMTPAQRQAESDKKADNQWITRQLANGVAPEVVDAEFAIRLQKRQAKRAAEAQALKDEANYEAEMAEIKAKAIM